MPLTCLVDLRHCTPLIPLIHATLYTHCVVLVTDRNNPWPLFYIILSAKFIM